MANKNKYKVQSLIFDRTQYKTKTAVKNWIKNNPEYRIIKYKRTPIDKNDTSYRVRQKEPWYFKKTTFKTIKILKSGKITAVVGKLK